MSPGSNVNERATARVIEKLRAMSARGATHDELMAVAREGVLVHNATREHGREGYEPRPVEFNRWMRRAVMSGRSIPGPEGRPDTHRERTRRQRKHVAHIRAKARDAE